MPVSKNNFRFIAQIGDWTIQLPKQSGGKAGKGANKTSSLQVIGSDHLMKLFRYKKQSHLSYLEAVDKAKKFANSITPSEYKEKLYGTY